MTSPSRWPGAASCTTAWCRFGSKSAPSASIGLTPYFLSRSCSLAAMSSMPLRYAVAPSSGSTPGLSTIGCTHVQHDNTTGRRADPLLIGIAQHAGHGARGAVHNCDGAGVAHARRPDHADRSNADSVLVRRCDEAEGA